MIEPDRPEARGGVWRLALLGAAWLAASCGSVATRPPAPGPPSPTGSEATLPSASPIPSPTPAPGSTPTPGPATAVCTALPAISSWSLALRAAQLVAVPVEESGVAAVAPSVEAGAGGVVLFGSTAPTDLGQQLGALAAQAPAGVTPPLVMTDEEGGGVQRMAGLVGSLPWAATMATTMTPAAVEQLATQTARRMRAAGVTMDLAPVLDLASGPGPDALHTDGPRSFSLDATTAAAYGLAFARGLEAGGVIPVVKHFPGEGAATANTDDARASTPPIAELEGNDLLPFEAAIAAGIPAVMVGDASVPGLSSVPASLSSSVVSGLLRQQLGFRGLVITDSLSSTGIGALGIGVPEAAVEAVAAGADMVLYGVSTDANGTFDQVVQALVAAVSSGRISVSVLDQAVAQVLAAKGVDVCASAAS